MFRIDCLLILVVIFQVITAQWPPRIPHDPNEPQELPKPRDPKCSRPPEGVENPRECCKVSPMYTEDELTECGFVKNETDKSRGPPDCSKQECLLRKRNLLNNDNTINYPAVRNAFDQWAMDNPEFKSAASLVKDNCMTDKGAPGPPHICEVNRLMFCSGSIIYAECPTWQDTEDCRRMKKHMEDCQNV